MELGQTFHGVVQDNCIQLGQASGLANGTKVIVSIQPEEQQRPWGEGLRASAGSLADIPGLDESLAEILAGRKNDTRREVDFD